MDDGVRASCACWATRPVCACCASVREALNVSELTAILGVAQSGVSRHLGLLRDAGLVTEHARDVHLVPARAGPGAMTAASARRCGRGSARGIRAADGGDAGRRRAAAKRCGGCAGELRPSTATSGVSSCRAGAGRRGRARSACCCRRSTSPTSGAAKVSHRSRRRAGRGGSIAVDRSPDVLARGRALARAAQASRTSSGSAASSSAAAPDETVDVALLSQALHHAEKPGARCHRSALAFSGPAAACSCSICASTTRPGSRERSAIAGSASPTTTLRALLAGAGFDDITVRVGARRTGDPFAVLIASGTKPQPGE